MLRLLIAGGLGNQLFQYAAVRAQAKRLGVALALDPLFQQQRAPQDRYSFWLPTLPIRAQILRYPHSGPLSAHAALPRVYRRTVRPLLWRRYDQPLWTEDPRFFRIRPQTIVQGYFQSLFYLVPRDEEILSEVDPRRIAPKEAREFARTIEGGRYVSVHVRRGDYVSDPALSPVFGRLDYASYLGAAMALMRKKAGRASFLVFSDDIEWCKGSGIFGRDSEFVQTDSFGPNPAIDLLFMAVCRHHIIANSSYSWWAAWAYLNEEKICILPKEWTADRSTQSLGLSCRHWFCL